MERIRAKFDRGIKERLKGALTAVSLAFLVERFAQHFHLVVQMTDHRALGELWIFFEEGVHDLIMLAHGIVEPSEQRGLPDTWRARQLVKNVYDAVIGDE